MGTVSVHSECLHVHLTLAAYDSRQQCALGLETALSRQSDGRCLNGEDSNMLSHATYMSQSRLALCSWKMVASTTASSFSACLPQRLMSQGGLWVTSWATLVWPPSKPATGAYRRETQGNSKPATDCMLAALLPHMCIYATVAVAFYTGMDFA